MENTANFTPNPGSQKYSEQWLRKNYRKGNLSSEMIAEVERQISDWDWNPRGGWLSLAQARSLVIKRKFRNVAEFRRWRKPPGIPADPRHIYGETFIKHGWPWFLGIRKRKRLSFEDSVREAERLATRNNGALQCNSWLGKHAVAVFGAMQRQPDRFLHIPQEVRNSRGRLVAFRGGTSRERRKLAQQNHLIGFDVHANDSFARGVPLHQRVRDAEKLARNNKGTLPCPGHLRRQHPGLYSCIRNHKRCFRHIPQEMRRTNGNLIGFRNGTVSQRRALEIKFGIRNT